MTEQEKKRESAEKLDRLLTFAKVAHQWKKETGEKLNASHYLAVMGAKQEKPE
jgi:hypothetical protein